MKVTRDRRPLRVRDLMSHSVLAGVAGQTLGEAAAAMRARRVGALIVNGNGRVGGILTERDLLRAMADRRDPTRVLVSEYMTPNPLVVESSEDVDRAAAMMRRRRIRHLPVVDHGHLVGFLSVRDLLARPPRAGRVVERW